MSIEPENITNERFPSNSNSDKKPDLVKLENRRVQKVVTGNVIKQKKTFWKRVTETFLGEDSKSVGDYIFHDVLIPSAKDMIADMVKGGIEMMLFGERKGHNTNRDRGKSYVSYASYYKNDRERESRGKREVSPTNRARHDFDEIVLETRGEAEEVLSHLVDLTIDYDMATVADLYDLVGVTPNFTDNKYGWTDLREASVTRTRGGYLINLPRTQALD